jgi:hypothetical protein
MAMAGAGSALLPLMDSVSRAGFLAAGIAAGVGLIAAAIWNRGWPAAVGLLALVAIEISAVAGARITPLDGAVCAGDLFAHAPLVRSLRAQDGLGRITVDTAEIMTSLGDLYGIDQWLTFVAGAPANVLRHDLHAGRTLDLFRVVKRATALPRAWIVHDVRRVTEAELGRAMRNPEIDLLRTGLAIEAVPELERCEGDEPVAMRRPDAGTVELRAMARCRGLVIVSEAMYPGWRAYVDGAPAALHEAYGAFRGAVIERGTHTVTMRYEPASVRLGAGLSLAGLLFCALLARGG